MHVTSFYEGQILQTAPNFFLHLSIGHDLTPGMSIRLRWFVLDNPRGGGGGGGGGGRLTPNFMLHNTVPLSAW